jgi:hypothetical protein
MTASGPARDAGERGACELLWLCICRCPSGWAGAGLGLTDGEGVADGEGLGFGEVVGEAVGLGLLCFLCGGLKMSGRSKYGDAGG